MTKVKFFQQAFVGGEVAPSMRGRIEDVAYGNGLDTCRNCTIRPQGMVENRAGFRFVRAAKFAERRVKLIPFVFSGDETLVLEFGHQYVRFHTQGATLQHNGTVYEVATPYVAEHVMDLHYVQSADVLTLVHPDYAPRELRRRGITHWEMSEISFVPKPNAVSNLRAERVRQPAPAGVPEINISYRYVVTVVRDGVESKASAEVSVSNDLWSSGNYNTITWQYTGVDVQEVDHFCVYRHSGGLYGFVGFTQTPQFVDTGITPDMSKTPPQQYDSLFRGVGNYPAAVTYHEQRRILAGTRNEPQKIWMTRAGTESDMSYSMPSRDDDRIEIRIAAREANHIRHIVPLGNLLLLTGSAEWKVDTQNSDVLSASTVSAAPYSYNGASNVQPVVVKSTLVYGAARGGHVLEMTYSWQAGGYVTGDLSLRAPHLFDGFDIVDMAFSKAPYPLVWFVSSNGRLLANTYVPEQEIGAWHWHDTDGFFESCAVVAEGHEDVLYVVVRRHINGQWERYIERLETRRFAAPEDAFFVDCGLTYSGAPATRVLGLEHLEGKTVNILADGAVHPQRVVQGGVITLQHPASKVQVGLPITADIKTLPVVGEVDNAYGRGRQKNVNQVWLDVLETSGIWVGAGEESLVEAKLRTIEPLGSPPRLKSGEVQITIRPDWNEYGQILVRQKDPLPLSIVSLTTEVAIA